MDLPDAIARLQRAARTLAADQGRIARRNARRRVLGALRTVRNALDAEYPAVQKPREPRAAISDDPAIVDARRMKWRQWEWKHLNPGRAPWDRDEAQSFVDDYAASIGKPPKQIVFDIEHKRLLGQFAPDRIRLAHIHYRTWDKRVKGRVRTPDWERWRVLLHEVAHYHALGHGVPFKVGLWAVFQSWKDWRAQRHGLAAAARRAE